MAKEWCQQLTRIMQMPLLVLQHADWRATAQQKQRSRQLCKLRLWVFSKTDLEVRAGEGASSGPGSLEWDVEGSCAAMRPHLTTCKWKCVSPRVMQKRASSKAIWPFTYPIAHYKTSNIWAQPCCQAMNSKEAFMTSPNGKYWLVA